MLKFINEIDQNLVIYQEYGVPETTILENGIDIPNGSLCVDKLNQEIYLLTNDSWVLVTDNTLLSNTTTQTINITASVVTSYDNLAFYQASSSKYYTSSYNGSDELSIILPDVAGNSGKWFVVEDSLGLTININKKTAEYGSLHKILYAVGNVGQITKTYFYCDGIKWRIAHSFFPTVESVSVTRTELLNKISNNLLTSGRNYLITDYRTCYDQPNYDSVGNPLIDSNTYKVCDIEPILVYAISTNSISQDAYQPAYPKDRIKYDLNWVTTETTENIAYGRITERIDEYNNRTDYDHRNIKFKRYKTYFHDKTQPVNGTITVTNFTVVGTDTAFTTDFTVNRWIAIENIVEATYEQQDASIEITIFKIVSITDDNNMLLEGINGINITTNSFYRAEPSSSSYTEWEYLEIKQNNLLDDDSIEIKTFQYDWELINNNRAISKNNYIGNHINNPSSTSPEHLSNFMLSNNVFGRWSYNNKLGDSCFDNSIRDTAINNTIGDYFHRNIIFWNGFEENVIGDKFYKNKIHKPFKNNKIGTSFKNNTILNSFNNNTILNSFNFNLVYSNFSNNIIDNNFSNNIIFNDFSVNTIGFSCNSNTIGHLNSSNDISYNVIGNFFTGNIIDNIFRNNHINNDMNNNNILVEFTYNNITNEFKYNTIGDISNNSFQFTENNISNNFKANLILNSFLKNDISFYFQSNQIIGITFFLNKIGGQFMFNDIYGIFDFNNIGFETILNNIHGNFSFNNIGSYTSGNNIYNSFSYNTINNNFFLNTIGDINNINNYSFGKNEIYNQFSENNIIKTFTNNKILDIFSQNTIDSIGNFQYNEIKNSISNIDFSTSTHVYNNYNCTIIKASDSNNYITYFDGTSNIFVGITQ